MQILEGLRFPWDLVQRIIAARALEHNVPGLAHGSSLRANLLDRGVLEQQSELMQVDGLQSEPLLKTFDLSLPSGRARPKQTTAPPSPHSSACECSRMAARHAIAATRTLPWWPGDAHDPDDELEAECDA